MTIIKSHVATGKIVLPLPTHVIPGLFNSSPDTQDRNGELKSIPNKMKVHGRHRDKANSRKTLEKTGQSAIDED